MRFAFYTGDRDVKLSRIELYKEMVILAGQRRQAAYDAANMQYDVQEVPRRIAAAGERAARIVKLAMFYEQGSGADPCAEAVFPLNGPALGEIYEV